MFKFNRPQLLQNNKQSKLYNENTFYEAFMSDLAHAQQDVIIESPFITKYRFGEILPTIAKLRRKGVSVTVNTRDPQEHVGLYVRQAYRALRVLQGQIKLQPPSTNPSASQR